MNFLFSQWFSNINVLEKLWPGSELHLQLCLYTTQVVQRGLKWAKMALAYFLAIWVCYSWDQVAFWQTT